MFKKISFYLLGVFVIALLFFLWQVLYQENHQINQAQAYMVKTEHPRIWLTDDLLNALRQRALSGDPDWLALKNWCDSNLNVSNYDQGDSTWPGGSYRGFGYSEHIISYALAYQVLKQSNPTLANTYAARAITLMNGVAEGFAVGDEPAYGLAAIRLGERYDLTTNRDEAVLLGITAGSYKNGYSARSFGMGIALGYDWLHEKLSEAEKQKFASMLYRWIDWYRGERTTYNNGVLIDGVRYYEDKDGTDGNSNISGDGLGYAYNNPADNFFSGYEIMAALAAFATYGDNPDSATYLAVWDNTFNDVIKPVITDPLKLKGGDSPEGWSYGSGYTRLMQALEAQKTASADNPFLGLSFPEEFFRDYLHATKSNLKDMYDHGEWTGSYFARPYQDHIFTLPYILNENYTDKDLAQCAQYYLNHADFVSFLSDWASFLWTDASLLEKDCALTEDNYYRSIGTGLVTMRSSWQNAADTVWASVQLDNKMQASHELYDEGHFSIQRGNDYLITRGASKNVEGSNSISFGGQNQHTGLGGEIAIKNIENTADYLYVWGDIAKAYQRVWKPSYATKFARKFFYLRPNIFIVYDDTVAGDGYEQKDWYIHFNKDGEPVIDLTNNLITSQAGSSKVFMKIFLPQDYTLEKSFVDNWRGAAWQIKSTPNQVNKADRFLNVFYATSLASPTPQVSRIEGANTDGIFVENKVIIFAKGEPAGGLNEVIAYNLSGTGSVKHLVVDLKPSAQFTIQNRNTDTGAIISTQTLYSSSQGTLYFTATLGSNHQITITPQGATPIPNVTLTKTSNKTSVSSGEEITYTIIYTNTGTAQATNLTITDTIPTGTTYVQGSATNSGTLSGATLTWTISSVPSGSSGSVSFRVKVN